jgi:hypothetical protein
MCVCCVFAVVEAALCICLVQATVLSLFISLKKQLAGDDAVSADEQVTLSAVFAHLLHGAC